MKGCEIMIEFKNYHPIVNFIYFVAVIGFTCVFMHPVCLIISLFCAFLYSVLMGGKKTLKTNLLYMLPMMVVTALVNPLFNHEGFTILAFFPNGNPLTFESLIYGAFASIMLVSVICWFWCYNRIMTSDKFIYLFGKFIPSLSLIFSMTLRFVPKFSQQLKTIVLAQKCIGRDINSGNIKIRIKNGLTILSVMITWAFENAIDTIDSMKSRGYGLSGRTAFSVFKFGKKDKIMLFSILLLSAYMIVGAISGRIDFVYFPYISTPKITAGGVSLFICYFILCGLPIIAELMEGLKWKSLK